MKKSDIVIGETYGVARSASEYDTVATSLRPAEVLEVGVKRTGVTYDSHSFIGRKYEQNDGVRIRYIETDRFPLVGTDSNEAVIPSRQVIAPWETVVKQRESNLAHQAAITNRDARIKALVEQLKGVVADRDGLGNTYDFSPEFSRHARGYTGRVVISEEAAKVLLEALTN